jgi:hypothetical protein
MKPLPIYSGNTCKSKRKQERSHRCVRTRLRHLKYIISLFFQDSILKLLVNVYANINVDVDVYVDIL